MKLQHLRFLVAAVECGGIGKAAERLHVSQPAVSAALKALEKELGQPLFERVGSGRRARPTSKGLQFHRDAVEILRKCDLARAQFRSPEPRPAIVRVGVLPTIAAVDIIRAVTAFTPSDRRLHLEVWEGGHVPLTAWLRQGRIDAAWTVVEKPTATARILWRERFVAVTSRAHRFARNGRSDVSLADLEGEAVVLRSCCEMRRGQLWPDTFRIRVCARAERDELAMLLVAQGLGIAIAPESLVPRGLIARPIHDLDACRSIGLRWRRDLPQDSVAAVIDAISAARRPRPP